MLSWSESDLLVYEDVITYPALKQDLAFAVAESVTAASSSPQPVPPPAPSCER